MLSGVQCSLILSNEISNVATALRQSSRYENDYEEPFEDALLEDFFSLQQKVLYMPQWKVADPFEYVAPFLDAIRSERVGAATTSTALAALWKLLTCNIVPASHHNSAETLKQIVAALQGCQFQASSNSAHEAVVTRLVQVFAACVCAEVGVLLGADDVTLVTMHIWKWCEYAPNHESMMKTSGIFIQSVRQSLQQLISCLFSRLRTCRVFMDEIPTQEYPDQALDVLHHPRGEGAFNPAMHLTMTDDILLANLCCGLQPFHDILIYCTEPMSKESNSDLHTDHILFSLQMLHTAIVHAGETLAEYEALLSVVRCEVFPALTSCLRRTSHRIHAAVFQVVFAMYKLFGDELLLQIEYFFQTSVLRLCEGRGCPSPEHQEIALEALLDFCGYPGFLRDIYLNLDCRIERSNLYEDICALLSKTAFPVKTPLDPVHMISMEGLLAMLLTLSSACGAEMPPAITSESSPQLLQPIDVWTDIFEGNPPALANVLDPDVLLNEEDEIVMLLRLEKSLKKRVSLAVDHFNRDFKKGFQYLQMIKLLPVEDNASSIAKFLRVCPNLNGHVVGEMLGDADSFHQKVLEEFTELFDFSDRPIEESLRMYFDAFKVPGEAQKIDRVVSKFGKVFFESRSDETFKSEDAVHVLAYSIIMLNTDLHKPEIKNKMTLEQFIRNNREINDGQDFPREMLERIYEAIREFPLRIGDGSHSDQSAARWIHLNQISKTQRGRKEKPLRVTSALDKDMFTLIWGPSVAAISVILDQVDDTTTVQTTLTGLKLAAKIAYFHGVDEVIDSLVVSLFKATLILTPGVPKALAFFGTQEKAQLASEAGFFIANKSVFFQSHLNKNVIRYTGSLGESGWRSVMDCIIRLSQMGVLHPDFWEDVDSDSDGFSEPAFELSAENNSPGSSVSATLWPFKKGDAPLSEAEQTAQQHALQCIRRCEIRTVFRDTKFLRLESLVDLIRAICLVSNTDEKTAVICMKLMFYIALRNRDRIQHVWPEIETHLESVINTEPKFPSVIIEEAVFGLFRVCQRSLTRTGLSGTMLRILQMVPNIGEDVIRKISDKMAGEMLELIKLAAPVIEEGWAWDAICHLLRLTATSNEAFGAGIDTLTIITKKGEHISAENFMAVLETLKHYQEICTPETVCMLVDLMEDMIKDLVTWSMHPPIVTRFGEETESPSAERARMWYAAFLHLRDTSMSAEHEVRNHTIFTLQRCVMIGEVLDLELETWRRVLKKDIMEMVQFLLTNQNTKEYPDAAKTLRLALKILTKTFLQALDQLKTLPDFPDIWMKALHLLQQSCSARDDELFEAVPEETKNLLLVMNKEGILERTWVDENGTSLWDATWRKAKEISFGLKPDVLSQ